jgi:hypothetical protein
MVRHGPVSSKLKAFTELMSSVNWDDSKYQEEA